MLLSYLTLHYCNFYNIEWIILLLIVIFSLVSDVLPYSIRVLLEAAVRNCDGFLMTKEQVMNILDWKTKQSNVEVPFFPARVLLQDFT